MQGYLDDHRMLISEYYRAKDAGVSASPEEYTGRPWPDTGHEARLRAWAGLLDREIDRRTILKHLPPRQESPSRDTTGGAQDRRQVPAREDALVAAEPLPVVVQPTFPPLSTTTSAYLAGPDHPDPAVKLAREVIARAEAMREVPLSRPKTEANSKSSNGKPRLPRSGTDADNILRAIKRAGSAGVTANALMNEIADEPTVKKVINHVYAIQNRYDVKIQSRTVGGKKRYFIT